MVAPFFGCLFGGFLFDVFLYNGADSPINTPYMGFQRLVQPKRSVWSNTYQSEDHEVSKV
jgi:aquaglyceroporin related protein